MKNGKWTLGENEPNQSQSCPEQAHRVEGFMVSKVEPVLSACGGGWEGKRPQKLLAI